MKLIFKLSIYALALVGISSLFSKIAKQYNLKEPMAYKIILNKFTSDYNALKIIDKIYFINLDRSKDRLDSITKELENLNLGVEYSRFKAVSGKDVSVVNLDNNQSFILGDKIKTNETLLGNYEVKCSDLDRLKLTFYHGGTRFPGEIGCTCSHINLWRHLLQSSYERILVLEDDIKFAPGAKDIIDLLLKNVPEDADLVYLRIISSPGSLERTKNPVYSVVKKEIASTDSYIITKKGAQYFLDNFKSISQPIDIEMSTEIEKGAIKAYVSNIFATRPIGGSVITEGN